MKEEIKLFIFVLSVLYTTVFTLDFGLKLIQDNPEPIKTSRLDGTLLYIAVSYIITYLSI